MPIEVGVKCVDQNVYVFHINLPYNIFLGRLWIHKIKVVTSTLHHSIKFMHNGRPITIHPENSPIDVCQAVERFWIPYELIKNEDSHPTPKIDIIP